MFKTYQKYIIKNFINKFLIISLVFFSLIVILTVLEEISFFKDLNVNLFYPYILTLLSSPITLFEIFPFIFLIATQFVFYDLFKKDELNLLKTNGLSNLKIIKILFFTSIIIGIFSISIFYNAASKLKFLYTDIKNNYSNDNKYLAVVNNEGLWLKDEIDDKILIVKSANIDQNFLKDVIISELNFDFSLKRIIQSKKIDIEEKEWVIEKPKITINNITQEETENLIFDTNFDNEKIYNLFSNISTLNIFELFNLKKDYENLGYSSDEIKIHLLRLFSAPLFYATLSVLSAVIMFNFRRGKSLFFYVLQGISTSVVIYYINFIFSSMGNNGQIPIMASIFLPILFISIIATIGLIRVNEK
jgi:lipopolysaccharide export system permease protein